MKPKDLTKILKEIPILLVDGIFESILHKGYILGGLSVRKVREDGSIMSYTVLNQDCDNLAYMLLHESNHHHYKVNDENFIRDLTDIKWKFDQYKTQCQNKIVELCDRWDL